MSAGGRRVVVTGIGLVSPIGLDRLAYQQTLREGRSGVRFLQTYDPSPVPVRIGAEIVGFDARQHIEKKERKRLGIMPRAMQLSMAAASMALTDAKLSAGAGDPERFGVIFGVATLAHDLIDLAAAGQLSCATDRVEVNWRIWGREGLAVIPPLWMLNHIPNMPASHVSILNDARGPCNSITMGDVSGLLSIGQAARHIQMGRADVMLAGGGDSKTDAVTLARHILFTELSHRNDQPEAACRPFDRDRDGTVLGEAGGVIVLEEAEHAARRGAKILAELAGFGAAFDLHRDGAGLARSVGVALGQAGMSPKLIDHVNAHGYGTRREDSWEAAGLRAALPEVDVLALKGYFGNLGSAAGVVELGASLHALEGEPLPRSLNSDQPDPPLPVIQQPRPMAQPAFVKVALTERGQCAAAVFRRWDRGTEGAA